MYFLYNLKLINKNKIMSREFFSGLPQDGPSLENNDIFALKCPDGLYSKKEEQKIRHVPKLL